MARRYSRREFVRTGAAAGFAAATHRGAFGQAPAVQSGKAVRPVVIASSNGNWFKNGGTETCVEKAFGMITRGSDVLDALIEGVNIIELDPRKTASATAGVPNADGVVQLDPAACTGPSKRAGGVARSRACARPPASRECDEPRPTITSWSEKARRTSRANGVQDRGRPEHRSIPPALVRMEAAHRPKHYPDPKAREIGFDGVRRNGRERCFDPRAHMYGTINCDGINAKGEICGVTTTSGPGLQDPRAGGRLTDSWRRSVCRRRGRRRRLDGPGRGQPLRSVVVPDRREHAPRHAPQGRRHGGLKRIRANTSRSGARTAEASPASRSTSTSSTPRASMPA